MFDDLNVESYARFAYSELSRRIAALKAQLPHEAGEIVYLNQRGREYLHWKYREAPYTPAKYHYVKKADEQKVISKQAYLARIERELDDYLYKQHLAEKTLRALGLSVSSTSLHSSAPPIIPVESYVPDRQLITLRGEQVRSKSELLIANTLAYEKIAYQYEPTIQLGNQKVTPDFLIPLKKGGFILWEHLGLLELEKYQKQWSWKKNLYTQNHFVENLNLIITKDTLGGIDTRDILYMIQTYHLKEEAEKSA